MNIQTNTTQPVSSDLAKPVPRSHKTEVDPILLELWETKRQINAEAKFDIAQLANQANAFDMKNIVQKLNLAVAH
jgi:hypothetical protein